MVEYIGLRLPLPMAKLVLDEYERINVASDGVDGMIAENPVIKSFFYGMRKIYERKIAEMQKLQHDNLSKASRDIVV